MYIALLVIPVPETNIEAYREWATNSVAIFKRYGCLEVIDGWADFVPVGKQTDFYRSVAAREGEVIVISMQVWSDKDTFYASEAKMHDDNALDVDGEPPFDASRLIFGCFESVFDVAIPVAVR